MKTLGLIAVAATLAAGAAEAQTAACNQMKLLLTTQIQQVKAFAGAETKRDDKKVSYNSTTNVTGFSACTFEHAIDQSKNFSGYQDFNLSCSNKFANSEAAFKYVEEMFACVKDVVPVRKAEERYMGGRYRITEMDANAWYAGRESKFDFGKSEYVRLWVRKAYPDSEQVHANLFYSFKR